ncbi:Pentatricopeptide repeat-containing protein [Abeliophyllum distichum]|uniref:Pentatricopeptide repeat-containing protein n=1 Tax=Abeliophyllum distichum TaxID=126358 RepID=A0ABD1SGK5_9LAMI
MGLSSMSWVSTLVMALCRENQVDKRYGLFKDMKGKKYLIDRAIYESLIEEYVADGKVVSACDLLEDLMDSRYMADLAIYNSLIKDLVPDTIVYSNAILRYVEARNIHEASTWYNRIKESSSVPSVAAYYSLGKGLSRIGEYMWL